MRVNDAQARENVGVRAVRSASWRRSGACGIALLCAAVGGCASDRDWAALGEPGDYPHRHHCDGVTVAAEPWTRHEDLRTLFDKLPGDDILALRLVIFNRSPRCIRFSSTQARLVLPDGREVRPLPVSDITKRLEANEAAAAAIVYVATAGYGAGISAAIAAGEGEKNWKRLRAARSCSMTLATLDPREGLAGFLFYECPPPKKSWVKAFSEVELKIRRVPRTGAPPLDFAITVPLSEYVKKENE